MRSLTSRVVILVAVSLNQIAALPSFAQDPGKQPRFAYVANNQAGTISVFQVDHGFLRARSHAYTAGSSPLSLALTPSQKFLYAAGNGTPALEGYAVNAVSGQLTALPPAPFTGPLFQLAVQPSGGFLVTVDGSSIQSYRISPSGALLTAGFAAGSSPTSLAIHPSGKFVYAVDVNNDEITALSLNSSTGALTPITGSPFPTNSQNPWAAAIDPAGHFLFVPNGNGANVSVFAIDATTGALTQLSGSPFPTGEIPDAVAVSPSGQFLYVGNGVDRTISAFSIDSASGYLTAVSGSPFAAGASGPLGLTIDAPGLTLYSMDHDSHEVAVSTIDPSTGALTLKGSVRSGGPDISMVILNGPLR
jgi:6-phosphogluconolactonase (cycloisomerase 2 family)